MKNDTQTVLITGGAGFIGSNLVHYLVDVRSSWNIVVADALTYAGNLENISSLMKEEKIIFSKCDITQRDEVRSLFEAYAFDLVFHLAAESHVDRSILSAAPFIKTNVLGTEHLLEAAKNSAVKRFLHVSTDEVYGSLGPTGKFLETTPLAPTSPYAASKAASDLIAQSYHRTHDLDVVITRCTNNYGPYQFPEKFIPLFISNALEGRDLPLYGDGMQVRNWLHVLDHCKALLLICERSQAGEVYNIGGGEESEIPNKIVAETIVKTLGVSKDIIMHVTDRLAHDKRYAIDFTKLHSELGWKPEVDFEKGLQDTIAWYQTNTEWWDSIKSGAYREYYETNYGSRSQVAS